MENRGSFSLQWLAFYVAPLISNPLRKLWFQKSIQSLLNRIFSNALARALAHTLQADSLQQRKLTKQAYQGVCFHFFALRQEGRNMVLGHCSSHTPCGLHVPHRVSRELHKALFLLHPVQRLFTLPGEKIVILLPELYKCLQSRLLLNTRWNTAQPSSQQGRVRAAAGLRNHLKLQTRKAEVFLPDTSST